MVAISNNNIARAIYLTTKGKTPAERALIYPKVVRFLTKKGLLSKASDILLVLNKIINNEEGRIEARISSVQKINEITKKELAKILARRYSAKEVTFLEALDEKLLGGFKVEVNDEVIDLTIKNRIGKLQEYLTSNA